MGMIVVSTSPGLLYTMVCFRLSIIPLFKLSLIVKIPLIYPSPELPIGAIFTRLLEVDI